MPLRISSSNIASMTSFGSILSNISSVIPSFLHKYLTKEEERVESDDGLGISMVSVYPSDIWVLISANPISLKSVVPLIPLIRYLIPSSLQKLAVSPFSPSEHIISLPFAISVLYIRLTPSILARMNILSIRVSDFSGFFANSRYDVSNISNDFRRTWSCPL